MTASCARTFEDSHLKGRFVPFFAGEAAVSCDAIHFRREGAAVANVDAMAMEKPRILHIVGIEEMVRIRYLSPDIKKLLYHYEGNVAVEPLFDTDLFDVFRLVVGGMAGDQITIPAIAVAVNAICDGDTNPRVLGVAEAAIAQLRVPVVNHPRAILRTTRDGVAATLAGDPDLRVPKTVRIQPTGIAQIASMIESGELPTPFLFREAGIHGGVDLTLIEGTGDLARLDRFAFDGREFYVTEFVDFRSPDGLYRKHRVFVVDGTPVARHMLIWKTWNVHAENRELMSSNPEYQEEERVFLETFSAERYPVFQRIAQRLELDFFGVDFAIDSDGRLLVFEANACFRAWRSEELDGRLEYHKAAVDTLRKTFTTMLQSRMAAGPAPAPTSQT
jgi:glutathione synthase/RimK-type ligase-like ATP-grasp enzyme